MHLSGLPELLLAWVKSQGTALLQGNRAEQLGNLKVGGEYPAKVLDLLPGGRHLVQVAGQKFDMLLPQGTRTGDELRLTFSHAGARPTFLLQQGTATPVQSVQISNTAQQVNALLRMAGPPSPVSGPAASTAPAALAGSPSQAMQSPGQAQTLGQLQPPPQSAGIAAAASVAPRLAAVFQALPGKAQGPGSASRSPSPSPAQPAATGVQASPSVSGRPIVANVLILQAQGALAAAGAQAPVASANTALQGQAVDALRAAVASTTTLRPTVVADPAAPSLHILPARLAQTVRESGLFYEAHLARWVRGNYPFEALRNEPQARLGQAGQGPSGLVELKGMPEEAARLAGQQLHMLEGGPFLWQGLVWAGQGMDWLVQERHGEQGEPGAEAHNEHWHTELRLDLPRMGLIQARLSLQGRDVDLQLRVREPRVMATLQEALPALQQGLEAAGLRAVNLSVLDEAA